MTTAFALAAPIDDDAAAWILQHVLTRQWTAAHAARMTRCACHRGICGPCERGRHEQCATLALLASAGYHLFGNPATSEAECVLQNRKGGAVFDHGDGDVVRVWLADRRCRWICPCPRGCARPAPTPSAEPAPARPARPDRARATSLYPTPTRLALLREVDAGNVCEGSPNLDETDSETYLIGADPRDARKVTARIEEMQTAGWVEQPEDPASGGPYRWALTDRGRSVLAAAALPAAPRGDGLPADEPIPAGCRWKLGDRVAWHVYPGTRAAAFNASGFRGEIVGGFSGDGVTYQGYGFAGYVLRVLDDHGAVRYISPDALVPDAAPHCTDPDQAVCLCCYHKPIQLDLFAVLVGGGTR